jgi:ATP-dependent exoDNAse (exonuclease V) beta subunit/RecB family exonuclease
MTLEWLAIEERVPKVTDAVRQATPAGEHAALASHLVQAISAALAHEPRAPAWLVAPSRRVARQWIDTIALGGTPVFNVRATTPRALCFDLAAPALARIGRVVASPRASLVLLEKVLVATDVAQRLRYFSTPRSYRRLAERMRVSLSAIRMAGLTADDIRRRPGFGDSKKGHDLALLLEGYAAALAAEQLVDAADVAVLARDTVTAGQLSPTWRRILVPAELEMRPLERAVFAAIGDRVQTLPIDPEPQSFADPTRGPVLQFSRAIGEVNEVRGVLRRCLSAEIPLDTVELLHTDAATYPAIVQEVLATMAGGGDDPAAAAADVPVTFADGLPIRESRPARALAAWLAWRAERHPQWRLLRMIRDGLLDWRREAKSFPEDTVTEATLLRELRRIKIGFDLAGAPGKVQAAVVAAEAAPLTSFVVGSRDPEDDGEFDEEAASRRQTQRIASLQVIAGLLARIAELDPPPGADARAIVARARQFLDEVAASRGQFDNNAKNRLVAEITDMERWLEKHPAANPRETLDWLTGLTDSLVVMGNAPRPGCLHVASLATGGHSGRRHTFLVGLDESRLPGPGSADPVLPDADRMALSTELDVASASTARARAEFWRLLGRLRGHVYLSYNCRDLVQQSDVFPCPLLLEAYRRSSGSPAATLGEFLAIVADRTESFVPHDPAMALNESEWWLAALGEDPSLPAVTQAARGHSAALAQGFVAEEARRSPAFTPWDGLVPAAGPDLDPTNPTGRVASAHSLESLGACPRRFFFRYGLDVKPLDSFEPEEDRWLDDMEHGSVLHKVLERFMERFLYTGEGPPAAAPRPTFADHEADILALLDEVLAAKRAEKPTTDEAAVAAGRRELADALRTFLRAEEAYCQQTGSRPVALEAAIGFQPEGEGTRFDRTEAVPLPLDDGRSIRLRGYVDRIDIDGDRASEQGYAIIDYKKGRSARFKKSGRDPLALFDKGRRLQHGLYVLMVRHVAREAAGEAGHVTRFAYLFPGVDTRGERVEWTAEELAGVNTLVERLCRIVRAGAFLPSTDQADCRFCDFLDVCGDAATTAAAARRTLRADERPHGEDGQTLAELFAGIREASDRAAGVAIARPLPRDFALLEEVPPGDLGDAAARQAIGTTLDQSMLVEASAGTGKTTCMVERMTALVRTGAATVGQIAAITFTNKAAAELARRLRERLERDSSAQRLPDDERQRLQTALAEIDMAVIGTVHSFCGRLLKERPIEAGLDPAVETLDGAAEQVLRGRAWREFCDTIALDEDLTAARQALEATGVDLRDLRSAFETIVAHGDVRHWPRETVDAPDIQPLMARIDAEITAQLDGVLVPWNQRPVSDRLMTTLEAVQRTYRTRSDDSPGSLFRAAEMLDGECPTIAQGLWLPGSRHQAHLERQRERKQELEQWWDSLVAAVAGPLRQWHAYRYQFAMPLLEAARDHYARVRLTEGVLSFHDLLDKTAQLLRERPDVRLSFAKRHPVLLVDEFQDTDPLQAEILLLLTADDPAATDWRSTRIKPGSLFVVGDPKQSIYRFRRADIDTFEFVKERIARSGGQLLHLNTNFRSNGELVTWVNDQFADRFAEHRPQDGEPYGPGFTESRAGRGTAAPGVLAGLRQLRVRSKNVRAEAEAVATFIRRAIDRKLTVPRTSAAEDPACRPEDFMIVTWNTGQLSTYAEALNAVGLPCDVTGRKGPDSKPDLALLHLCLRVVADTDDTVAALAVLRGPVFGFSDADLHAFHRVKGRIDGRLFVPDSLADKALAARLRSAAETFHRWRRIAGALPLAAAIETIADDAGLMLVASAADGRAGRQGRAAAGTIATLIERVRAERSLLTSVQDVIDRIDDLLANEFPRQDFDTASIDAAAGGAVRVMNLHKVKGLEAPVVFLCDEDGPDRDRGPAWHVSRSEAGATGYLKISRVGFFGKEGTTLATPSEWHDVEATERRYLEAEYLRLNYVAGTRPGTCLVVSVFENTAGEITGGWRELSPDIANVANLPDLEPHAAAEAARVADAARPPADEEAVTAAREQTEARARAVRAPTFATVTPRDFLTEPAERIRHTGRGLGQEWGTVIHRLLELAVLQLEEPHGEARAFDLRTAAESALEESDFAESGIARQELVDRAVALVGEIQRSPAWQRIRESRERHVEVPFTIAVSGDEIPEGVHVDAGPGRAESGAADLRAAAAEGDGLVPVLIRGQIDAVFDEAAAGEPDWVVLDWKTTSVAAHDAGKLEDHYRPQLALYARCWAAGVRPVPE